MLVPFENLSTKSKIWIYQSDRKLNESELKFIKEKTEEFLVEWTAHGNSLQAGIQILYEQFIIIGVNEEVNEASGCSIDKSVKHIQELETALNLNLMERSKIAILENAQIRLIDFSEIKNQIGEGRINEETVVFNNALVSKEELDSSWLQPAAKSWMKRYF